MKQFFIVLKFELSHFTKNKAYILSTVILSAMLAAILLAPMIIDMFTSDDTNSNETTTYALYGDEANLPSDEFINAGFVNSEFILKESVEEVQAAVEHGEVEAGFLIDSLTSYRYVVNDTSLQDSAQFSFDQVMQKNYQYLKIKEAGLDFTSVNEIYNTPITNEAMILGKDGVSNYIYTYILIFALYFLIIFYGQMIAASVASEKSNRAIEVLVTSAPPNCLIFGKVIANALAGIIQFGIIVSCATLSYQVSKGYWGGSLDFIFNIPLDAILSFSAFGLLGYLFYSFIFGAIGALASKTEDINSSATPITIIFVIAFMVTAAGMADPSSMMMVIASHIPFSSFMSMFVRVAMGSVSFIEVMISLMILALSTVLVGILAAKIYRLGTLRYGNPITFKDALKQLKHND